MKNIYFNFIANFVDKRTRASAHARLLYDLEKYNAEISVVQKQVLLTKSLEFSRDFSDAWPWKKFAIITQAIKAI
jgi:hypothetical protein